MRLCFHFLAQFVYIYNVTNNKTMNINIKAGLITALILGIIAFMCAVVFFFPKACFIAVMIICITLPIILLFGAVKAAIKQFESSKQS